MEEGTEVLVRELCLECNGEGERLVQKGSGHVGWSAPETCTACDGTGRISRWIPVAELHTALDDLSASRSR